MTAEKLNRLCGHVALGLSFLALATVLLGFTQPRQPAPTDEGALAHIFQLSIALLAATVLVFGVTADWKQPQRSAQRLAVPAVAVAAAFAALYVLEHIYLR